MQRSAVTQLPEEIRGELDKRLVSSGFSNYQGLADWLIEQGYEISRSAVHRYGQEFERRLSAIKVATEQAKAITSSSGDEEGAMNEALIRLVQQKAFDVLLNLAEDPDKEAMLPKMGVMISRITRASVAQKKWQAEVKKKTREAVKNIEEKTKAQKKSLDPETLRIIREEVYGIV